MSHDIFISYSAADRSIADAVCGALEGQDLRCWIAPRDVPPGANYANAIMAALHSARLFVVVFSTAANESVQVEREVDRAVSARIPMLAVRVQNVMPSASMEYYLAGQHWLDALTDPFEDHLEHIVDAISSALLTGSTPRPGRDASSSGLPRVGSDESTRSSAGLSRRRGLVLLIGVLVAAAALSLVTLLMIRPWGGGSAAPPGKNIGGLASPPATSNEAALRIFVIRVSNLLDSSRAGRGDIAQAVNGVLDGKMSPREAAAMIRSAQVNRQSLLNQVMAMTPPTDRRAITVYSLLQQALQHSKEADRYYESWLHWASTRHLANSRAGLAEMTTSEYFHKANAQSQAAHKMKQRFVAGFNALAKRFGFRSNWRLDQF